ncbi:MAG TPA: hypothetical protein IAC84_03995 [Firmicutes bacterium]|nr:hypothetical protein [Bacillota bacterium]
MSHVTLLAADSPLPLYDPGARRIRTVRFGQRTFTMDQDGFSVQAHGYYRVAVDDLELPIKPFRYELNLQATQQDAELLRDYLDKNLSPGEQVQVWNLWVGTVEEPYRAHHFSGALPDLQLDTLEQMEERYQTCLTIEKGTDH